MVTFEQFFNSETKARLVKFFVYNSNTAFEVREIALKLNLKPQSIKKPLEELSSAGFLKSRKIKSKRFYQQDPKCHFKTQLKNLVLQFAAASHDKIYKDVKKIGSVKLVVLGGVFLNTDKFRVDIFIVVDKVRESQLRKFLKNLEAEVGKEISYAIMGTKEFKYRMDMFDRFVRDILEFPHEKIINKLKV